MPQITLAAARVNAGLTQKQAADAINIDKSTLLNWEKGRTSPSANQLKQLSVLYNMPMDFIFLPDTLLKVDKNKY